MTTYRPRPYQKAGKDLICSKPAVALMLDMGLGKTVITLTAIEELVRDRMEVRRVLVIAPLRVAETTWTDESSHWDHLSSLRISKVLGSVEQRRRALSEPADVYVINRENVEWLSGIYGQRWPFDMVVIDESSSFKNHRSKRFRALRRVLPRIRRIVELTGTPAPNGLMDLWSQVYLLDRGERLGRTIGEYRRRWFRPGAGCGHVVYEWEPARNADSEIHAALSDICFSMRARDCIDLPPLVRNTVKVMLPETAMKRYRQMERDMVLPLLDEEITAASAAALSNKLLQLASGAAYNEDGKAVRVHDAKLDALAEVLEINEHNPVLVFYWFRHDLERLMERFPKARKLETAEDIREWNAGKVPVMLAHPASAGHGLNLQHGGSIIVWFSLTWSLELYQQANKRLHRSGQRETVVIHHLVARGTIDEAVMKALDEKKAGQDAVLDAVKARIEEYVKW